MAVKALSIFIVCILSLTACEKHTDVSENKAQSSQPHAQQFETIQNNVSQGLTLNKKDALSTKPMAYTKSSTSVKTNTTKTLPYSEFLKQAKQNKRRLTTPKQASDYLFGLYNQDIANYWVGTPWDFNGVTRTPQQGNIACGYFITNTLNDLGFGLQRVKLAQAPSSKMIKQLTVNIKRFSNLGKVLAYVKKQPNNNLFIVGLDFHTGFLLKQNNKVYFLHSSYINREGVIKEDANNSPALNASKSFMLGSMTDNKKLMKQWLHQ